MDQENHRPWLIGKNCGGLPSFNRWDSSPVEKVKDSLISSLRTSSQSRPSSSVSYAPKMPIRRRLSLEEQEDAAADTADLLDQALRITGGEDVDLVLPTVPFRY